MKKKRGEILIGNVVFLILNALFLFVLILFLVKQGQGAVVLEQVYAKEIALLADSAKPGMQIIIDMEKGFEISNERGLDFVDVVSVKGNVVEVKLSSKSGYTYSFFNDVNLNVYPDKNKNNEYTGLYVLNFARN
jgi:hypothetical protein